MKDRTIAIRNVYVMMAYAFRSLHSLATGDVEAETFEHLHDLLAEILNRGVSAQVKRGLHHEYLRYDEQLTTIRGRIDVARTVATRIAAPGKVACSFDEYEPDTTFNQVLKCVIVLLIRNGNVARARKDALRRLLPYFETVTLVTPRSIRWNGFTYQRTNASYRLLIGVCQLIVQGLLPTEEPGTEHLSEWLSDEAMSALYERFVREYYAFHHPEFFPAARLVAWDYEPLSATGAEQLPAMRTDVTLKTTERMLIIDAKYYGNSMATGAFGKVSVHSANLYQLLTYVKNADVHHDGRVGGLLLYAQTEAPTQPALDVMIQGNRVQAHTLDLNAPWEDLRAQLESYLAPLG